MVGVDAEQATLTFDQAGVTPGVAFEPFGDPRRAVFHLTRGYALTRDAETTRPRAARFAWGRNSSPCVGSNGRWPTTSRAWWCAICLA